MEMEEQHRKRTRGFELKLLEEEMNILTEKAKEARMTKTAFVRNIILYGVARPKTNFSRDDADRIVHALNRIGNDVNKIAYQANFSCGVSEENFKSLCDEFHKTVACFESLAVE